MIKNLDDNKKAKLDETQKADEPQSNDEVTWSSEQPVCRKNERRNQDRRQLGSRAITVPDMRSGIDRRSGEDRRKVRLTITGRAMDA